MTIDPRIYEKYSGKRPGDAINKLGAVLAQGAARKQQREVEKDNAYVRQTLVGTGMGWRGIFRMFRFW